MALVTLLVATSLSVVRAQQWSGVIGSSRAVDWSTAGVKGGIPNRTTTCATLNPGATAAQINSAISACPSGQVVMLNAGTYTLSGGIVFSKSGVTLRGQGADATKLIINGTTSGCSLFYQSAFRMCTGSGNIGSTDGGGAGPDHSATWSAGYAQGSAVITLSNTTGLAVGSTIFLDQANDGSDGFPAAGDLFLCDSTSNGCSNQGGNSFARVGRVQTELHEVTAISGSSVTISPGVLGPNYRSSQSPGAWWGNSSVVLQNSGVENLTIDFTAGGDAGIEIVNATNCWVKGVRLLQTGGPGSFVFHVLIVNGFRVETRDNYFYGPTTQGNTQYSYTPHVSGSLLLQNNIFHHSVAGMIPNDPEMGSVYAYNYVDDLYYSGAVQLHSAGSMLNLYEGNTIPSYIGDILHGPHYFETLFRNLIDGYAHNQQQVNENGGVVLLTNNRFFNLVGNVIGHSHFTTYEVNQAASQNTIFGLGFRGTGSGSVVANDANVKRTLLRWGNWDSVTSTNDTGTNDATGTRFVSGEVPSTIPNFPSPVPSSQTLPASFYLSAKPSWFGAIPWPPVGPDVANGNVSGVGGHANKIPARVCFEAATNDPAYASSNPRIRVFNADACYGTGGPPPTQSNGLGLTP